MFKLIYLIDHILTENTFTIENLEKICDNNLTPNTAHYIDT